MKSFLCIIFISMLTTPVEWLADFSKALDLASKNQKNIILSFSGSDWCGPCIRMKKEFFDSEVFNSFAKDRLVAVRADFPRLRKNKLDKAQQQQNDALADKYNQKGKFPLTLLLDA